MARKDWQRVSPKWQIGEEVRARFPGAGFRRATIVGLPKGNWRSTDAAAQITVRDSKGNVAKVHFGSIYIEKRV